MHLKNFCIFQEEIAKISGNLANIANDEAALDVKIERKQREFDQQQKRLAKLQVCHDSYISK